MIGPQAQHDDLCAANRPDISTGTSQLLLCGKSVAAHRSPTTSDPEDVGSRLQQTTFFPDLNSNLLQHLVLTFPLIN